MPDDFLFASQWVELKGSVKSILGRPVGAAIARFVGKRLSSNVKWSAGELSAAAPMPVRLTTIL